MKQSRGCPTANSTQPTTDRAVRPAAAAANARTESGSARSRAQAHPRSAGRPARPPPRPSYAVLSRHGPSA